MSLPPDASPMFRACVAIAAQHPANVAARKPDTDYGDFLDMLGKHEPFAAVSDEAATRALYWLATAAGTLDEMPNQAIYHAEVIAKHLSEHMDRYNYRTPEQLAELDAATRGDRLLDEAKDAKYDI